MNATADTTAIFIGGGNMGSSLVKGLVANNWRNEQILFCEQDQRRRDWLQKEFSGCTVSAIDSISITPASIVILAIKPQDMRSACEQICNLGFSADALFISIAAGVPTRAIRKWLGGKANIVRCMPNTPAAIGQGITGLYTSRDTTQTDKDRAEKILRCAGETLWVTEEPMLDAVTALSGSGPAYLFYFMECLQESGKNLGLSSEECYTLTLHTIVGAANLAALDKHTFEQLRANVTSKGGTTEQAIDSL